MTFGRTLPVLMYHHISPQPGLVTCSPGNFRSQMAWLAENGWQTLSTAAFAAAVDNGVIPDKSVLLTFDDGYLDNRVHAQAILQEFGLRATIFVITAWLGNGPARPLAGQAGAPALPDHRQAMHAASAGRYDDAFLRWSEVEAMRAGGIFDFHSHTHTHTRWDRRIADPAARRSALAADLAQSRAVLSERLGESSSHLCWPQGYFDASYQQIAAAAGFRHLYTTEHGVVRANVDPARIPRLVVKDKPAAWFGPRLNLYRRPLLSAAYIVLKARRRR